MKANLLTTSLFLLALGLSMPACLLDFSDDLDDGCDPGDVDYPDCLPIETGEPQLPPVGDGEEDLPIDGEILVQRLDYRGSLCASGVGMRIVVGSDNDGDGALNTEMDGSRCVDVGDAIEGSVGVAFCLDALTCLNWGVAFDLDAGLGVRLCVGHEACLALGVQWSDEMGEMRLCWDPDSDASVPSDQILHEEIVCQPPSPCSDAGECEGDLVCHSDLCVLENGSGDLADDGSAGAEEDNPGAP